MLKIEHLTKAFGDKLAVDDLSLHIAPGEIYGLSVTTARAKPRRCAPLRASSSSTRVKFSLPDIPCAPSRLRVSALSPTFPTIPIFTTL